MKIRTLNLMILCFLLIGFSCNQNGNKSKSQNDNDSEKSYSDFKFIDEYPVRTLPLLDSTNFDNFKLENSLSKIQVKLLDLTKINSSENTKFYINYRLRLSKNFSTLVITYYPDENNLFTVLINYNNNSQIIDFLKIAFDEIAESCLRKETVISDLRVEVKDYNYCPDMFEYPKEKTTRFVISSEGKINASH